MINVGIIGAGRMGERHYNAYQKISGVNVIGITDIDEKKSQKFARKYKLQNFALNELIKNETIDAVSVCTPNQFHHKNSILALKNNKHVIVEKPMALKIKDCENMIKLARENKLVLMVGHTYRFYPSSQKVKQILDSKKIGKVKMILGYGIEPGMITGKQKTPKWSLSKENGGGVFWDVIHAVDLLQYWLNSDVKEVNSLVMDKIYDKFSAEQMGLVTIKFKNKVVATLMPVAPSWGIRDSGLKIIGENGMVHVTYGEEVKVGKKNWIEYKFKFQNKPASFEHNLQGFVNELSEFITCINKKEKPMVSGEIGKKNVKVISAIYESEKKKKVVKI